MGLKNLYYITFIFLEIWGEWAKKSLIYNYFYVFRTSLKQVKRITESNIISIYWQLLNFLGAK